MVSREKSHWVKTKCEVEIKGIIHYFFQKGTGVILFCCFLHATPESLLFSSHCRDRLWSYCSNWLPSLKLRIIANSVIKVSDLCGSLAFPWNFVLLMSLSQLCSSYFLSSFYFISFFFSPSRHLVWITLMWFQFFGNPVFNAQKSCGY